jgi:uncharacterized protein YidB (DUF937 family)
MGLLDTIVGAALRGGLGQEHSQLLPGLLAQILGRTDLGSIGGLLAQLQQGGLGSQVSSWLGNGANMPLNPGQLRSALGDGRLAQMAQAAGIPSDQLTNILAQLLPGAVDHMSPNGKLQEPDADADSEPSPGASGSLEDQAGLKNIR